MKGIFHIVLAFFLLSSCVQQGINLETDHLILKLDEDGLMNSLVEIPSGKDYIVDTVQAPFLSIQVDGVIIPPNRMERLEEGVLRLSFNGEIEAGVNYFIHPTHISFELVEITQIERVQLIVWGPYPTTINKSIGETVGVVRGESFTLGLQALNPKTLGGYPWNENDCMPQIDIFENEDYSDLSEEGKRYVLYRVEAAKPEVFGSTLQAYCRSRNKARIIENWGHKSYHAPPFDDGGIIGSKIAFFGCPVESTLDVIGQIELSEGLPHPMIDGEWGKNSRKASSSYMILGFGEEDIEKALDYTSKAGLDYLYHPGPFETWGHFPLNAQFPNGRDGLKNCVAKAENMGIRLGVHTLSNFITTNDKYVTPVPDERLAKVGRTPLVDNIDENQNEIIIEDPLRFVPRSGNNLRTVQIDEELIQYETISQEQPWKLMGCIRGAFGTQIAAHEKGTAVALLADHAYQVFLSDAGLSQEIGKTLAELYNNTGIRQISFDGLEGNRSTGMGNYGEILMTNAWFENLNENIRSHYIADASRTSHYFWHIYTRMNWGEPWYAGFRESQTEYRFKNQKYFERNLMPGMLGWFLMTEETNIEDIEWMLAKASGYNAGFGFVSSYKAFSNNGSTETILQQINVWESARLSGVFNDEVQSLLKDVDNEFHLEKTEEGNWLLTQIGSFKTDHSNHKRQPGEPTFSKLIFNSPTDGVPLIFIITALEKQAKGIVLKVDNNNEVVFPATLHAGETLKYVGGDKVIHYNKNWIKLNEWKIDPQVLASGSHTISIDCAPIENGESKLKLEVRIQEKVTEIFSDK